jgi:hypothetical protein
MRIKREWEIGHTVEYFALQYSTMHYSTVQCSTPRYYSIQYSRTPHCCIQHHNPIQSNPIPYRTALNVPFEVCLESSHPRPAVNMIGLIHSTLSLLGNLCPKERAKPHTTGSPYLLPIGSVCVCVCVGCVGGVCACVCVCVGCVCACVCWVLGVCVGGWIGVR